VGGKGEGRLAGKKGGWQEWGVPVGSKQEEEAGGKGAIRRALISQLSS
jgi:hypothetical protein